jgi:hypothetical protein
MGNRTKNLRRKRSG